MTGKVEQKVKVLHRRTSEKAEQDIVERVFLLGDQRVNKLMTQRTEIVWLDVDDSPEEIRRKITEGAHSRFPVCQGSFDHILGVVQVKNLLARSLAGQSPDPKASMRQPLYVPESMRALKVLKLFKRSGMHIALVIDEYGSIQGLITLNDILETIVGDKPSVDASTEPLAVQREDGSWLINGMLPVYTFREIFHIAKLPGEEKGEYQTLRGFVMMSMERIPSPADHFEWGGCASK